MAKSKDNVAVVILAAGHGKRLKPLTHWLPKPLVPVGGSPILVTNLSNLVSCGFRRAVVVYGRPTTLIPDFLDSLDLPDVDLSYAFQKEQRGTGDALLTGMNEAGDSGYCLLMVGDAVYSERDIEAVWERFVADDVDGCLMLKELPVHKLFGSSMVVLNDDGTIATMLAKPSAAEIRDHKTTLADASLHIYSSVLRDYLSQIPLSRTNELEVTSGLVSWIADGAKIAGVVRDAPTHITHLEDFITHNVPFGGPLVALTEIERAVAECDDKDISGYVRALQPRDIRFVYRRLLKLSGEPMGPTRQARALAIISEVFRHQANAIGFAAKPELDEMLADLDHEEVINRLAPRLNDATVDPAIYHYLAVAYGRHTNASIGQAVFADTLSRVPDADQPVSFRNRVEVNTPARLAFSSSQGSDISYIIEEKSAVILNCAIKVAGDYPGTIVIERVPDHHIQLVAQDFDASSLLRYYDDIFGHIGRDDPLILLKACLRFSGIIDRNASWSLQDWLRRCGGGMRVVLRCVIPRGSGLGCSAILAAGLISGLRQFAGLETSHAELLTRSYCCERFYGRSGYQDIIGGSLGGIKLIQADASTGLFNPKIEAMDLGPEQLEAIAQNVIIFHTGQPHNDNPYLLAIPAKYFARSGDYMYAYENGKQLTFGMAEALREGDWARLGKLVNDYWDDREYFEEGVTPPRARKLRAELAQWSYGTALCGSGHGGYMMVVPQPGQRGTILNYLAANGVGSQDVLDFEVSREGPSIEVS